MKYGKSNKVLNKKHAQDKKKARSTDKKGCKAVQTPNYKPAEKTHEVRLEGITRKRVKDKLEHHPSREAG